MLLLERLSSLFWKWCEEHFGCCVFCSISLLKMTSSLPNAEAAFCFHLLWSSFPWHLAAVDHSCFWCIFSCSSVWFSSCFHDCSFSGCCCQRIFSFYSRLRCYCFQASLKHVMVLCLRHSLTDTSTLCLIMLQGWQT